MKMPRITLNRHFYITVACIALVFTVGVLSDKAWHSQVVRNNVSAAKQHLIETDQKRRQAATVATEKAKIKAECDKEIAYYNALPAIQKSKQAPPECQTIQYLQ